MTNEPQRTSAGRLIKSKLVSNKCIILNRPMIFTSSLRYRLFGVLSDIRWVVNNVLPSRRMDTNNKYKARLPPESLRYD